MICEKCNKIISDNNKPCIFCGHLNTMLTENKVEISKENSEYLDCSNNTSKKPTFLFYTCVAIGIISTIVLLRYIHIRNQDLQAEKDNKEAIQLIREGKYEEASCQLAEYWQNHKYLENYILYEYASAKEAFQKSDYSSADSYINNQTFLKYDFSKYFGSMKKEIQDFQKLVLKTQSDYWNKIHSIHVGMTKEQVLKILGDPINTEYNYSGDTRYENWKYKNIEIEFFNYSNRVSEIEF